MNKVVINRISDSRLSSQGYQVAPIIGYGFSCTNIEKQAKRWALSKRPNHIVNIYSYIKNSELKILKYEKMADEWLDFVVYCRKGM